MAIDRFADVAVGFPAFDHRFELLAVMRAEDLQTPAPLARQVQTFVVVHLERLARLAVAPEVITHNGKQARSERFIRRRDGVHVFNVLPEPEETNFLERLFLRIKIVVEAALLDAEALGDIVRRGAMEPLLGKDARGGPNRGLLLRLVARTVGVLWLHSGRFDLRK